MSLHKLHYNRLLPLFITAILILTSINLPNNVLNSKAEADVQESNISSALLSYAGTVSTLSESAENITSKIDSFRIYTSRVGHFSAAIKENGDLYCWGNNERGHIGTGDTVHQFTPVKVLSNVKKFTMGSEHTAAIKENGDLYCWGSNGRGEVGMGSDNTVQKEPVKVLENIKDVSLGYWSSAAISENGDLYCWGDNRDGEVGNGTYTKKETRPIKILDSVSKVYTSETSGNIAAIKENGDLYCWGHNRDGQVGNGTQTDVTNPTKILENIKSVSFGWLHMAAVKENGDLYCWGYNYSGQIGNGKPSVYQLEPVKVLENVEQVKCSGETTCAITKNGDLYCWGDNDWGQIGNGDVKPVKEPVKIMENVRLLPNSGIGAVITKENDLYCWGVNSNGSVGNGTVVNQFKPVKVLENIKEVSCGDEHKLAISYGGEVYGWGYNGCGQVGNGTTDNQPKPVNVLSFSPITDAYSPDAEKIPKLSADQAKQFLAFVYNDSKYEEVDLTEDKYYKLLTGDLSSYNDDGEQLLADIYAFSMFVRANIDSQLSQSEKNTKYLSDNLIEYFKSELNGMNEVDDQIFNEYKNTWTKRLEDGLTDIMSTELAKHTGIVITEDMFDNIELGISTYNDISSLGDKITTYVKRLCAGVQGFFLPLEKEKLGRYSYFSSYLDNRGSYSSCDDIIFETIMDYNFLAAKENSYISSAIDMTTWITGKDSWSNHREELDDWAEYLYQLESFVKSMYNNEEKQPAATPTVEPTVVPIVKPTSIPTVEPTEAPTVKPTATPTVEPTETPTMKPTATPAVEPAAKPTVEPTVVPIVKPTSIPTVEPTEAPTVKPTATPMVEPTAKSISSIKGKKVIVKSVKNIRGKKVVIQWKKAAGVSGYQVQYATNKKFKKATKKLSKNTSITIQKLKKKTYFIRLRVYYMKKGKKIYGKWSAVKKMKVKK